MSLPTPSQPSSASSDVELVLDLTPEVISANADDDLWVFNKPAGMLSHPDGGERSDLLNWTRAQPTLPDDLSLIHRLDIDTSGVICCARTQAGLKRWGRYWANHLVEKYYFALVFGHPHPKGTVRRPLQDQRRGQALEATTRYKTIFLGERCALIEARIIGGRKHQVRRHLQGIGHGVIGDRRYRQRRGSRTLRGAPPRMWLHAHCVKLPDRAPLLAPLSPNLRAHLLTIGDQALLEKIELMRA
jgi:23S rRNA-/tRNA-specific pseudouridylate synthase